MSKVTIEMPDEMKASLVSIAESADTDVSKLCRKIIRQHIGGISQAISDAAPVNAGRRARLDGAYVPDRANEANGRTRKPADA